MELAHLVAVQPVALAVVGDLREHLEEHLEEVSKDLVAPLAQQLQVTATLPGLQWVIDTEALVNLNPNLRYTNAE